MLQVIIVKINDLDLQASCFFKRQDWQQDIVITSVSVNLRVRRRCEDSISRLALSLVDFSIQSIFLRFSSIPCPLLARSIPC